MEQDGDILYLSDPQRLYCDDGKTRLPLNDAKVAINFPLAISSPIGIVSRTIGFVFDGSIHRGVICPAKDAFKLCLATARALCDMACASDETSQDEIRSFCEYLPPYYNAGQLPHLYGLFQNHAAMIEYLKYFLRKLESEPAVTALESLQHMKQLSLKHVFPAFHFFLEKVVQQKLNKLENVK